MLPGPSAARFCRIAAVCVTVTELKTALQATSAPILEFYDSSGLYPPGSQVAALPLFPRQLGNEVFVSLRNCVFWRHQAGECIAASGSVERGSRTSDQE